MMCNTHIEHTAADINRKVGLLKRRSLAVNNPDIGSHGCRTLVGPTLGCCSMVWDPHIAIAVLLLEMVQCQAARWVKNDYVKQSSVTQLLADFQWWEQAQRQTDARLSLMYKIVHNLVLINLIKYVKLQRNLISLQQILTYKKYYDIPFVHHSQRLRFPTKNPPSVQSLTYFSSSCKDLLILVAKAQLIVHMPLDDRIQ